jgi:hypothetical protein
MRPLRLTPYPLLALLLAGCGGGTPEPAEIPSLAAEPALESGFILGVRPLAPAPGSAAQLRLVSQVVGVARGAGTPEAPGAVEVTIRLERGGRDIALIEPAGAWMRPGQRVRFTPGARPALAQAASGA